MRFRRALFIIALALVLHSSPALGGQAGLTTQADHEWCDDVSSWRNDGESACEVREITLDGGSIDIDAGGNGSISVTAWDDDEIRVSARVVTHADDEDEARDLLRDVAIDVDGGRVEVDAGGDWRRHRSWSVSFRVLVPRETDLDLNTSNGSISITGVAGRMRFRTSNGSLHLSDLAGDVEGRTSNGSVAVDLTGDRWQGTGLDVTTSNGSVRLGIPEGYSARLETGTVNGRVDLDFPVTVQGRLTGSLSLDLGDGGAPVRVKTTNGRVRLGRPE